LHAGHTYRLFQIIQSNVSELLSVAHKVIDNHTIDDIISLPDDDMQQKIGPNQGHKQTIIK